MIIRFNVGYEYTINYAWEYVNRKEIKIERTIASLSYHSILVE